MTDCCSLPEDNKVSRIEISNVQVRIPTRAENACPTCGQKGKSVDGSTVKSLLSVSLRQVRSIPYFFCQNHACPTVYFSDDGLQTFGKDEVRERVYQKEPDAADVLVCYCFRHKLGEIRAASPEAQRAILDDIHVGVKAGQCACDLRNPQGSCCLGNVRTVVRQAEKLIA